MEIKEGKSNGVWSICFFFFKQKTAYEIYQCDWSSDVCSSDLSAKLNEIFIDPDTSKESDKGKMLINLHVVMEDEEIGRASCRERV